jgi:uncharacterized protein YuzE
VNYTHDEEIDAWYFEPDSPYRGDIWRTQTLGLRTVNIDYDEDGNVVGVEVL